MWHKGYRILSRNWFQLEWFPANQTLAFSQKPSLDVSADSPKWPSSCSSYDLTAHKSRYFHGPVLCDTLYSELPFCDKLNFKTDEYFHWIHWSQWLTFHPDVVETIFSSFLVLI
jgi:hypothetical protein